MDMEQCTVKKNFIKLLVVKSGFIKDSFVSLETRNDRYYNMWQSKLL